MAEKFLKMFWIQSLPVHFSGHKILVSLSYPMVIFSANLLEFSSANKPSQFWTRNVYIGIYKATLELSEMGL